MVTQPLALETHQISKFKIMLLTIWCDCTFVKMYFYFFQQAQIALVMQGWRLKFVSLLDMEARKLG